jgi:hypothetical protein
MMRWDDEIAFDLDLGEAGVLEVVQLAERVDAVRLLALRIDVVGTKGHLLLLDLVVAGKVDRVLEPLAHDNLQTTLVADLYIGKERDHFMCREER